MDSLLDIQDAFSRQALSAPWGELGRSATLGIVALYSKFVVSVLNSYSAQGVDTFRQHVMHRDAAQGLITVCNHTSTMDDPMLICSLLPASFFFREHQHHGNRWSLCAAEICYSNVLLGQFFQSGKTLPIQRGGGIDQPIMRTVAAEIARGHWVHVFPEGKVTYTGTLGPLRWGIGKLVCDARRRANGRDPVVLPFYHSGMGRVLPKHAILPRTGNDIAVVVGEPLDLSDLTCRCNATGDDLRAVWRDITKRVGSALYELEARVPPNAVQAQGGTQQQDQERSRELDSALPGVPTERQ